MAEKKKAPAEKKKAAPAKPATRRAKKKTPPSYEEIAMRAYFIHLEEGGGDEMEHWLRAERELEAG